MKKIIVVLFLLCFMVTGCGVTNEKSVIQAISVEEVREIVDNYNDSSDVVIIDVREEYEYEEGHIVGAINVPLSLIEQINVGTDSKIIVYCQSGRRSQEAASYLVENGYKEIFDMGGINNWPYELVKAKEE